MSHNRLILSLAFGFARLASAHGESNASFDDGVAVRPILESLRAMPSAAAAPAATSPADTEAQLRAQLAAEPDLARIIEALPPKDGTVRAKLIAAYNAGGAPAQTDVTGWFLGRGFALGAQDGGDPHSMGGRELLIGQEVSSGFMGLQKTFKLWPGSMDMTAGEDVTRLTPDGVQQAMEKAKIFAPPQYEPNQVLVVNAYRPIVSFETYRKYQNLLISTAHYEGNGDACAGGWYEQNECSIDVYFQSLPSQR